MDIRPAMITAKTPDDFSALAAGRFLATLENMPRPLIALPTGNTPLGLYRELAAHHTGRRDLWDRARFITLDEYLNLPPDDPRLFYNWLAREFFDPLGIPPENRIRMRSNAPEPDREAARIQSIIDDHGGIDMALLGLGENGHLALNEPGSAFDSKTRMVALTPETVQSNARYWGDPSRVPRTAITLGLYDITRARSVILLVTGAHKAGILKRVLHGPVTPDIPATCLRTIDTATVIADGLALPSN